MSHLPDGWVTATINELAVGHGITDGPFGSNLKTAHYTSEGPRVIRLQNIGDGHFKDEYAHIAPGHFEQLRKHAVEPADVLVASLGEQLPRACLAPPNLGPAIVKADCVRIRTGAAASSTYLMWALNSPQIRDDVAESIKGVGRPRINLGDLRSLQIPVAPRAEQERIVAAIEEAFSKLDAGEAGLRTVRQLLQRMRNAVLAAGVTGRLVAQNPADTPAITCLAKIGAKPADPIDAVPPPVGWAWASLGALVHNSRKIAYGVLQPGDESDCGVPMIRVMDLARGGIETSRLKRIDPAIASKFPRTALRGGEVLLSVVGTIGRVAVVPDGLAGANVARAVSVLPLDDSAILPGWAVTVLRHEPWRLALELTAHEVARKTLNLEDVRRFRIPIPPIEEQARIVAEADRHLSYIEACERAIDVGVDRSAALRRSVLKAAFEGRLVPQDSADEPASELLGRILADRATSDRSSGGRRRNKVGAS